VALLIFWQGRIAVTQVVPASSMALAPAQVLAEDVPPEALPWLAVAQD
jgi:hypothetical protein